MLKIKDKFHQRQSAETIKDWMGDERHSSRRIAELTLEELRANKHYTE